MTTDREQHRWRVRMLLLCGAMLVAPLGLPFIRGFLHLNSIGFCAFRAIVGMDCPACGMTRSATALLTGDIRGSFHHHPAGPMIVAIIALIAGYLGLVVFTNFRGFGWRDEVNASTRMERVALGILLIGWVGKTVVN